MNSAASTANCPVCGTGLPVNAPQGLCPKCLFKGVAAATEAGVPVVERPPPPSLEAVQAAFPQLEIIELVGRGGMGAVYKARQPKLNRYVALKILPQAMGRHPAFAERFAREGQMLARLNHPNVVTVHDFGQANGFFYLLMEYVDGVNLRQAMQAGRFTSPQALSIVPMICEALQYAHDEGVLHRDIKPENILLDTKGRVRLVDFGIAKLAFEAEQPSHGFGTSEPPDIALTQSGSALGTPDYMAPEQRANPSTVDQRADIYSLGVVFYEMLTGELPMGRFDPPSRKTQVDARVDDVVLRAIEKQKEKRFRSADEVRTRVEAITATNGPGQSTAAAIPPAAEGYPIPLSQRLRRLLLIELIALLGLMLNQVVPATWFVWGSFWSTLKSGWAEGLIAIAGAVCLGWLGVGVWRRRDWLLAPLQGRGAGSPPPDPGLGFTPAWTEDRWLTAAWMAVLAVLSVEVIWILLSQVTMLAQSVSFGSLPRGLLSVLLPTGATLLPAGLAILLVILFVRRELRRKDSTAPAPAPTWMGRAVLLALGFAIVTSLPTPGGDVPMVSISMGGLIAVLALAISTRSRLWRAITLALLVYVVTIGVAWLIFFVFWASGDLLPIEWSGRIGPFSGVILSVGMQLLILLCHTAGLAALLLPQTAAAFGLRPPADRAAKPPCAGVDA